ncbi:MULTISPECIES: UvrD-helicase domain-containing protein [Lysinibacillus]|uniref:DNA 3'-5' helicase n=1 Tax=Lysinibacillus fusiformis TaxID=28031 RepID=A0A1E4R788_9BACI|nr:MULTISPECIES: ATP-dependent helicase [Lysinibacillus]ODV56330.1 hypothetical protein BG258_10670 [Lysinibacillus fusiformis]
MSIFSKKLKELDTLQYEAFISKQNTIVRAGPGSGKTTILTMKIADLLNNNIKEPRGLACITFTKDAAKEFSNRVKKLGVKPRENVYLGTLHAFCITQIILPFKLTSTKHISTDIANSSELKKIFTEIKDSFLKNYNIEQLPSNLNELDEYRNSCFVGISKLEIEVNGIWEEFISVYEKELITLNKTDYIFLVKQAIKVLTENQNIRNIIEAKFKWLLVDEYQDFNKLFHELVLVLKEKTDIKLFIVGDPNQSVYSFMGGSHEYFYEFYEDRSFKVINLQNNYRSTQDIVNASASFLNIDDIEFIAINKDKLKTKFQFITCETGWKDQVKYIAETIIPSCDTNKIPRDEICILASNNYRCKNIQSELLKYNIKGRINKDELFNNEIIQFIITIMKYLTKNDYSFNFIINTWFKMKTQSGLAVHDSLYNRERLFFYKVLEESRTYLNDINNWISKIIELLQLENIINGNENYTEITEVKKYFFEEEIITVNQKIEKLFPPNELVISTRHSSKGLEFDVIILLEMEDGKFPSTNVTDEYSKFIEEKRLFFVCITRAKKDVYLLKSASQWELAEEKWVKKDLISSVFFDEVLTICSDIGINYDVKTLNSDV